MERMLYPRNDMKGHEKEEGKREGRKEEKIQKEIDRMNKIVCRIRIDAIWVFDFVFPLRKSVSSADNSLVFLFPLPFSFSFFFFVSLRVISWINNLVPSK